MYFHKNYFFDNVQAYWKQCTGILEAMFTKLIILMNYFDSAFDEVVIMLH